MSAETSRFSGKQVALNEASVEDLRQTANGLQASQDGTSKRIADLADQASGLDARVSTLAALSVRVQDLEGRTKSARARQRSAARRADRRAVRCAATPLEG